MDTVKTVLIFSIIVLLFFGLGKIISKMDRPLFKKIFKTKRNIFSTDIMVNNYWGNMISIFGVIVIVCMLFDPTEFAFYGIISIAIVAAYIMHVADAAGVSIDNAINVFLNGTNKSLLRFMQSTICFTAAFMISGYICTSYIAPKVLVPEKHVQEVFEFEENKDTMTTKDKEEKFYNDIKDFIINEINESNNENIITDIQ